MISTHPLKAYQIFHTILLTTMHDYNDNTTPEGNKPIPWRRILYIAGISVGALLLLTVILLTGVTLYLTPERLTNLINKEASENLDADVKTHNVRFTIWSSFPHFCIEADSVEIISRSLKGISPEMRKKLPADADSLLSTGHIRGGINIIRLLAGKIYLRNLEVNALDLNVVALNDTVNNYSIVPEGSGPDKIPYFTISSVNVKNAKRIRYYSAATDARIDIDIAKAEMIRKKDNDNSYNLSLNGIITANVGQLPLLRDFPVELDGQLNLRFKPFAFDLKDYSINLGGTHGKMNLDMNLDDNPGISSLNIHLNPLNLSRLAEYIPGIRIPALSDIRADVNIDASAKLLDPYLFSSTTLPSLDVNFKVADGILSYSFNDGESYSMTHCGLTGHLFFDGKNTQNSYFELPAFTLSGEGMNLRLEAKATRLLGNPIVEATLQADADLDKAGSIISYLRPYALKGNLSTSSTLSFSLNTESGSTILSDLRANGVLNISDAAIDNSAQNLSAKADLLTLNFDGKADSLSQSLIDNVSFRLNSDGKNFNFAVGNYKVNSSALTVRSNVKENLKINFTGSGVRIPLDVNLDALGLNFSSPRDTMALTASKVSVKGSLDAPSSASNFDNLRLNIKADGMKLRQHDLEVSVDNLSTDFSLRSTAANPLPAATYRPSPEWYADSLYTASRAHSSLFLTANMPKSFNDFMAKWRVNTRLKMQNALILATGFPLDNRMRNLDLEASFDSIVIHNMQAASGTTALKMNGSVGNLRRFLNSPTPQPLPIRLNVAIDTVNINQLAHAYEAGVVKKKGKAALILHHPDSVSAADTVAMMIPRNLIADINATAKETKYMNLRLYDLNTDIRLADGNAIIDTLGISSDFGKAGMNLDFNTADILKLGLGMNLNIYQINVVNFFKNFHTLLLMMPQMKNLSANLSASCNANLSIYPNMYVNVPSLAANIYLRGWDIKVHQNDFIRHITRMMLIRTSEDLYIDDMVVHASVHDNLLELYPFKFNFDNYSINLGGVNNFNGNLYYHIGIDKSPIRLPFGINIVGHFRHPELRFGGPKYKVDQAQKITSSVMENNNFNMMMELKYYIREFIQKAAMSDSTASLSNITGYNNH